MSAAIVFLLTPVAARFAGRIDLVDRPRGYRVHDVPTPYLGGAAVMAGFAGTMLALAGDPGRTLPVLGGVLLLAAVGVVDDRKEISVVARVVAEVVAAVGLWAADLGWDLGQGAGPDLVLTVAWVVAVVNAFNLFDNMDGASSAMALVAAAAAAVFGVAAGDLWLAATGAALAGACLGFLPHNLALPNARIFLGDGGSMPLGFAVASLVLVAATGSATEWQALVVGLLLVGVPALDTTLVTISRRRRGISVLTGGRDHLTHRTVSRVRTARRVAGLLGGLQALVASLALFAVEGGPFAIVVLVLVFLAFAASLIVLFEVGEEPSADDPASPRRRARPLPRWVPDVPPLGSVTAAAVGLAAGLTPFLLGLYDASAWVPIGVGALVLAAVNGLGHPPRLSTAGWLVIAGLGGLAAWALLSVGWAESAEQAYVDGNRWVVLTSILGVGLALIGSDRLAVALGAGIVGGLLVVAAWVLARMVGGDPASLFVDGRLNAPLEYVNGEGTGFLIGMWLSAAAAERHEKWVAGAGFAFAVTFGGLLVLSQSRGVVLAVLASVVLVLAVVPGRLRRLGTLVALACAILAASGPLRDVYASAQETGAVTDAAASNAVWRLLSVAVAGGLVWVGMVLAHRRLVVERGAAARVRQVAVWAVAAAVAVGAVGALASASRLTSAVEDQLQAFKEVGGADAGSRSSGSRLTSGAGNRYDYWRVAWKEFESEPLHGVGAGNYARDYFLERRTDEDVRQPHSMPLQVLAELGVVGGALLLLLLAGLALGALCVSRAARESSTARLVAVGSVGAVGAWAAQTSVDWIHLLPGPTGMALLLTAGMVRRREPRPTPEDRRAARPGPRQVVGVVAFACVVAFAGASLARQGLAEHYRDRAFAALPEDPARALQEANRALRLDREAVRAYYAKAAALARVDAPLAAETVLLDAVAREPSNFVTWALLGDLSVRQGRVPAARVFYARALALSPLDPGLQRLVNDPASALTGKR